MSRYLAVFLLALALAAVYILAVQADLTGGGVVALTVWTIFIIGIGIAVWKEEQ